MEPLQDRVIAQKLAVIRIENSANPRNYLDQKIADARHAGVLDEDCIELPEFLTNLGNLLLVKLVDNVTGNIHPEATLPPIQMIEDRTFAIRADSSQASH
ncbi:hypothetical protein ACIRSJ_26605 [Streptomyces virginiae]|uniref:hypothetical protein n=1 Tax=Streptomyces virginiae TaxID=1961 RepID=UPI00380E499E